jgi:RNA polymerase sigma factor (sigma-70 family)
MSTTDADPDRDAALVAAHLAGDRAALGEIYDRYADALHDTAAAMLRDRAEAADAVHDVIVLAAERLDQLRDPRRLRPWLFAILRNQVYTRTTRRARTRPVDFAAEGAEMPVEPSVPGDHGADVDAGDLAALVRDAASGLDERDQLVLEFAVRQQLAGDDLAAALGVSLDQSYVLVHRMRERVERALGALTVARMGRAECPDLADVLGDWDGRFSVLVRKRVARHVDRCEVCGDTKRRFAALSLIGAAPLIPAPADLRQRVLTSVAAGRTARTVEGHEEHFDAPGGFPSPPRSTRRFGLVVAAVVALVLVIGGGIGVVAIVGDDDAPTAVATTIDQTEATAPATDTATTGTVTSSVPSSGTSAPAPIAPASSLPASSLPEDSPTTTAQVFAPPAAPATTSPPLAAPQLTLSTSVVDFGVDGSNAAVVVGNTGGLPLQFTIDGLGGGFTAAPSSGSVGPGQSLTVTLGFDRSGLAEGRTSRPVTVTAGTAGSGAVQLEGTIDRPPAVRITTPPASPVCPDIALPTVVAEVLDVAPTGARLTWSGPGPGGSTAMSRSGANWSATMALPSVEGTWSYTVTATDAAGHTADAGGTFLLDCPTPG